jgi:hypothetical protein
LHAVFTFVSEIKMFLTRTLVAAALLAASLPAAAKDLTIQGLSQDDFHKISQDLGAALSYKPLAPAEPLGLFGFDLGIAGTDTKIKNTGSFNAAGVGDISDIAVPSARFNLGLPFGLDVGVMAGAAPSTNVRLYGGEVRWAFIKGSTTMPAVALRGSYTKLGGVDQLDFDTKGLDLSISKGIAMFTPYAGIGKVWVTSTPKSIATATPSKESLSENKYFVGVNMNFILINVALEADKTGDDTSYGLKLGFRF